jgi:hypothetical protein
MLGGQLVHPPDQPQPVLGSGLLIALRRAMRANNQALPQEEGRSLRGPGPFFVFVVVVFFFFF